MEYKIGSVFGKLTVVGFYQFNNGARIVRMADCKCSCGNTLSVEKYNLGGNTKQCKDCAVLSRREKKTLHGSSYAFRHENPIGYNCYTRWQSMKRRCYTPSDRAFNRYGGRGIKVCDRWLESYDNFLSDMGLPPTKDHQIDRVDNDGNYEPGNCRWVSRTENARNKSSNRNITAFGETKTLAEWSSEIGVKRETIARRLNSGSSPEEALSSNIRRPGKVRIVICPHGSFETISDCARALGMSISGVHNRVNSKSYPEWNYG